MNAFKSFLATYPVIGLGTSMGGSILPFIVAINPLLQFAGLTLGLVLGYLTLEAKLAERKERKNRKPSINPELIQDFKKKAERTQNGNISKDYDKKDLG